MQELNGAKQWQEHLATRKHKNAVHRQWKKDNKQCDKKEVKTKIEEVKSEEDSQAVNGLFDEDDNLM